MKWGIHMKDIISKLMMLSVKMKVVVIASAIIVIAGVITTVVLVNNNPKEQGENEVTVEKAEPVEEVSLGTSENSVVKETEKEVKEEPKEEVKVDNATDSVEVMAPVVDSNVDSEATVVPADEDDLYHSWNLKATWTASNGVVIKINDAWADAVLATGDGAYGALWQDDPEADWSPNSLYMDAVHEFIYGDPAYKNGMDRYNPEIVKVSDLPQVPTVSTKQSSISVTPEFSAYKEQWDRMLLFQATGNWEGSTTLYQLQINNDFAGQVASGQGYMWLIEKNSDGGFKISIHRNLSELSWDGLLTVLKLITPDAQAVYDAVYEQFYYGADWIVDYDNYYIIPNSNSEIMVPSNSEYAVYYIK